MPSVFAPGNSIRDRYQVEALIGQGGMGAVYRVADLRLPGRLCALKVMRHPVDAGAAGDAGVDAGLDSALEAARQQFLAEASTLARLDHPNLVKVSDYFGLDSYDCLVMDYVAGPDLQQCAREASRQDSFLPEMQVLGWIDQLCDVLTYLHDQHPPIIHGDIKPANIKLTADGRIKLVDFGLARPSDPTDPRTVTGAGLRGVGSLPYAALEQYAGNAAHIDPRTDLYALGATLYHLLTNIAPASAHDRFLDPAALTPPRQINPGISPALADAIEAAMQPHPRQRPESVAAWRLLLPAVQAAPVAAPPARRSPWQANGGYAAVAALLLLVALILTLFR